MSCSKQVYWREIIAHKNDDQIPSPRSGAASVLIPNSAIGMNFYVFGGYGGEKENRLNDFFVCSIGASSDQQISQHKWQCLHPSGNCSDRPEPRENNGLVYYKPTHKLYLYGGYNGIAWLDDFWQYDIDNNEWTEVQHNTLGQEMTAFRSTYETGGGNIRNSIGPGRRFGYVSAVYKDSIHIYGGYNGVEWLNSCFSFDLKTMKWRQDHAPFTTVASTRSCPAWCQRGNSVYIFGGYNGITRLNDFYEWDLETGLWTPIKCTGDVPSARYFHSCEIFGDYIYTFGGYNGSERLNDLHMLDLKTSIWYAIKAKGVKPKCRSSFILKQNPESGSLILFSGYNGQIVLNDFFQLDIDPYISDMRKLLNNAKLSDVSFVVEGQVIYASRLHLAARSDHFCAMFFGEMSENDINHSTFLKMLEFIYTDFICQLDVESGVSLLIAAERFLLPGLKNFCEEYLKGNVNLVNVVFLYIESSRCYATSLCEFCIDYIIQHLQELKTTNAFQELTKEPELLMKIIMRQK